MLDTEAEKTTCEKALKLQFLMGALKQQEESLRGQQAMLEHYHQGNPVITILIDTILEHLNLGEDFLSPQEENFLERFNNLIELTFDTYYRTKGVPRLESSDLPPYLFLNWRQVVRSVRAQVIEDRQTEKMCFANFIAYQYRNIETYVSEISNRKP